MSDAAPESTGPVTVKRDRSPSFPYIGLSRALERAQELYAKAKRSEARMADAASAWGLGAKSSSTLQTAAALLAFGLLEDSGSGDGRKLKVSELARRILEDTRPGVKDSAMAEAANKPALISEMAVHWKDGRPDDSICISELKFDKGFTDDGARAFLRVYDDTIRFTGTKKPDSLSEAPSDSAPSQKRAKLGDFVNVEIDGVLQFSDPVRVRAIQEHEGRTWIFIDGSETGVLMEQVRVVESVGGTVAVDSPPKLPLGASDAPAFQKLQAGEREWLRGPLSKETAYRLVVSGDLGPKEIGKLIKLLEAQKAVLSDDDLIG